MLHRVGELEDPAVQAVQAGAQDFLVKGQVEGGGLARAIRYARERKWLDLERVRLLASEREARATAEAAVRGRDEVLRVVADDVVIPEGANLNDSVVVRRDASIRLTPLVSPSDRESFNDHYGHSVAVSGMRRPPSRASRASAVLPNRASP